MRAGTHTAGCGALGSTLTCTNTTLPVGFTQDLPRYSQVCKFLKHFSARLPRRPAKVQYISHLSPGPSADWKSCHAPETVCCFSSVLRPADKGRLSACAKAGLLAVRGGVLPPSSPSSLQERLGLLGPALFPCCNPLQAKPSITGVSYAAALLLHRGCGQAMSPPAGLQRFHQCMPRWETVMHGQRSLDSMASANCCALPSISASQLVFVSTIRASSSRFRCSAWGPPP